MKEFEEILKQAKEQLATNKAMFINDMGDDIEYFKSEEFDKDFDEEFDKEFREKVATFLSMLMLKVSVKNDTDDIEIVLTDFINEMIRILG